MKFTILGSGGAMPTPRVFHQSKINELAKKFGEPYKRNSSCFFVHDIASIVDCPEDIGDSINRRNINSFENLFITHWHPDHTFGLRVLMESLFDFYTNTAIKKVNLYMPKMVYFDLVEHYPSIDYYINVLKVAELKFLNHGESIKIKDIVITALGFSGKEAHTYGYNFFDGKKNLLYAPCDTIELNQDIYGIDILVHECGIFNPIVKTELSFDDTIKRLKKYQPQKVILTHIENCELEKYGVRHFKEIEREYKNLNLSFAYDGLDIEL